MECIGDCKYSKNGVCTNNKSLKNNRCMIEQSEMVEHTPTYAEEQLEHAHDKENRCYNEYCTSSKDNICHSNVTNKAKQCIDRKEPINYKEEYNKLKKENEGFLCIVSSKNSYIEKLEKDNLKIISENTKLYKENEDIKIEIDRLCNIPLTDAQAEWGKQVREQLEVLQKENEELKGKVQRYKQGIKWKDKNINDFSVKITILENEIKVNKMYAAESGSIIADLEKEKIELKEEKENCYSEILRLEKENKNLKETFNKKQNQWENEQVKQVEVLIKENEVLKTEIDKLNYYLKLKAAVIEKLEQEINNLNEIIERKNKELDGERKGNTYLESENKSLLDRINKYQDSILNKQIEIKGLKDQLENEIGRNRILNEKLEELKKHNNQGYMEQMNLTINEKNEEIEELKRTLKTRNYEYSEIKRQHENQRLNIKSEMSENRELKAKVIELEKITDKIDNLKDIIIKLSELL